MQKEGACRYLLLVLDSEGMRQQGFEVTDRDVAVYGVKAGYGVRGASLGGKDSEATEFRDHMLTFWSEALGG